MEKALEQWDGSGWGVSYAEKDDPYIALAFRNAADPLGAEWQKLALRIFRPLFEAREEAVS